MASITITSVSGISYVVAAVADGSPNPVAVGLTAKTPASSATMGAERPSHLRLVK